MSTHEESKETPLNRHEELINLWNIMDERSRKLLMAYAHGLARKAIPKPNELQETKKNSK